MAELTEKQVLENCHKMWIHIAETGCDKDKAVRELWPGTKLLYECWACEYVKEPWENGATNHRVDCTKCPIWPAQNNDDFYGCEHWLNSPYADWFDNHNPAAAQRMADLCLEKLKGLNT